MSRARPWAGAAHPDVAGRPELELPFREGTSAVRNATPTADIRPERLTKVRVPAGHYRVVSSNYGNLWLETCTEGRVSDVQVAQAAIDAR